MIWARVYQRESAVEPSRQLIVFDLDGTLVDSRQDLARSVNTLLVECGAKPLDEHTVGTMVGDGAPTLVGDSAIDWQTARNAAARACLVRYGFGFESVSVGQLAGTELIVETPEALLRVL